MTDIERDAARYRWIKAAPRLRIDRMPDSHFWISETGEQYSVSHSLCAFDTGFSGLPTLDDLIDQAMDMYPIAEADEPAEPAPPADGEVAELVAWLQEEADDYACIGCEDSAAKCNRAAELLQRQALVPVSVSERPWEREGWCDADGRCWWGRGESDDWSADWTLATPEAVAEFCEFSPQTVCLPAHALPLPEVNNG